MQVSSNFLSEIINEWNFDGHNIVLIRYGEKKLLKCNCGEKNCNHVRYVIARHLRNGEKNVENEWHIESFDDLRKDSIYIITKYKDGSSSCTCPDHIYRENECKHIRYIRMKMMANPSDIDMEKPIKLGISAHNVIRYIDGSLVCTCHHYSDYGECSHIRFLEGNLKLEYEINEYLKLKLEDGKTVIYVNGKQFLQCKYLLINIPISEIKDYKHVESIDEAEQFASRRHEGREGTGAIIPCRTEFWGHCSNLQAWYEHDYDTRLLHKNLAFPLLKELMKAGDKKAKEVFKDEIATRIESGYKPVVQYLKAEGYFKYFSKEEKRILYENTKIKEILDD